MYIEVKTDDYEVIRSDSLFLDDVRDKFDSDDDALAKIDRLIELYKNFSALDSISITLDGHQIIFNPRHIVYIKIVGYDQLKEKVK